jgi:hypothetical protein
MRLINIQLFGGRGLTSFGSSGRVVSRSSNRTTAIKKSDQLPDEIKNNYNRFVNRSTNKYENYKVTKLENGDYIFQTTKAGDVPGSKAIYYKQVDSKGKTISTYKDTYDQFGNFVHRKYK